MKGSRFMLQALMRRDPAQLPPTLAVAIPLCLAALHVPQAALASESVRSGLWSSASTWDAAPDEGDHVTIKAGHTVTYDIDDSRVAGVTIEAGATLAFNACQNTTLETDANVVVFGMLQMHPCSGTSGQNVHTLRFVDVDERKFVGGGMDPIDSDVGLWVRGAGKLDLVGTSKTAWTRLADSASAKATAITLEAAPSGWRVGDEIAIVPTLPPSAGKASWNGFDVRTITAIDGATVILNTGLSYDHPDAPDPFSSKVYTAEVLNLTRNVRIEGTGDGSADPAHNGRAHVNIMASVPQTIRYVAIRHMGPRHYSSDNPTEGVLGRYGLHFHHSMDGSRGTLVRGVVVRDAGFHAFVPHASHGITFQDTIAYNAFDDAYWWDTPESRDDTSNNSNDTIWDHAVAALIQADPDFRGYELAGFMLGAGKNNTIEDSVAVGVQGNVDSNGFHWPEAANQQENNVWIFNQGNIAHNNKVDGIYVWQNDHNPHVVQKYVAYRNGQFGIEHGAYNNRYAYLDAILFDNPGGGVELHAAPLGEAQYARADGYDLRFEGAKSADALHFTKHTSEYAIPVLFKDCVLPAVTVDDRHDGGDGPTKADFVSCTKPNGGSLEPADFKLISTLSGTLIRVQRPDGTAFQIDAAGKVTTIKAFYDTGDAPPPPVPSAHLAADPNQIQAGESSTLSWSSSDADSCAGTNFSTGGKVSGSESVSPTADTTYTVECTGPGGSDSDSAIVTVAAGPPPPPPPAPAPTASLVADPTSITVGESATLSWSSTDADSCAGTGFSTGGAVSGSQSVSPTADTTYTVECTGPSGSDSGSATVTVAATPRPPAPAPTASLVADPSSITVGESATLSWSSTDADSCAGTNFSTGNAVSGSQSVSPAADTTYSVQCTGPGGSASDSAKVTVASAPPQSGPTTLSFNAARDTMLRQARPTRSYGSARSISIDADDPSGSGNSNQGLLYFDVIGPGAGQVPAGATIESATLTLRTIDEGDGASFHRMLQPWSDSDTWSSRGSGIQPDGVEAMQSADLTTGAVSTGSRSFDVTASVQAWANGQPNYGWALLPSGTDGWDFGTSEASSGTPRLTVTFTNQTVSSTTQ